MFLKLLGILFSFVLFSIGMFVVFLYGVHYVNLLLVLELMLLGVLLVISWEHVYKYGLGGVFVFLLVMVCMGGFSISLLVSVSRHLGRDYSKFVFIF